MPRNRTETRRLVSIFSAALLGLLASHTQQLNRHATAAAVQFLTLNRSRRVHPQGSRHVFNDGPGKYDDYKPLLNRETLRRLDDDYSQKLESAFQEDFRITSKAFRYIVRKLGASLGTNGGRYPREFVALTALWHLGSGGTYREVTAAMRNGVSKATVMRHVHLFIDGVCEKLHHHIRWPDAVTLYSCLIFMHALISVLVTGGALSERRCIS